MDAVGKGWAKGLTAASDPRVLRAAAGHRGLTYTAHLTPERDRRRVSPPVPTTWSPTLAYAVGLIATDGCLTGGDTIAFTSADRELVQILLRCLRKSNRVSSSPTRTGGVVYRAQIGDVALYRWLVGIGVTPRKSFTIGAVDIPDALFLHFVRGLLDGDGSIMNKVARADTGRRSDYYWEYLQTKFVSASREHVEWLRERLRAIAGVEGYMMKRTATPGHGECYALRFGKTTSVRLLPLLYADPIAPRLSRKWEIWARYAQRHDLDPHGRSTC